MGVSSIGPNVVIINPIGTMKAMWRLLSSRLEATSPLTHCTTALPPVPPLEGFVMNRVQGDYFETLLYKIFVSIDEQTNVSEVGSYLFLFLLGAVPIDHLNCFSLRSINRF